MSQDRLIELIKQILQEYQQEIEKITEKNNSTFERYHKTQESLAEDKNNIINLSEEEIASLLSEIPLQEEEREQEFNYLKTIRKLLNLNITKQTTFQLTPKQEEYIALFKSQLQTLEQNAQESLKEQLLQSKEKRERIKSFKRLLGILEDPKNKEYISEIDAINQLLEQENIEEVQRREFLYGILRYNYAIYQEEMSLQEVEEHRRLNKEEVKDLLNNYNYDFQELTESKQEDLLNFGKMEKIAEVLECMKNLKFPRLDLKRNGAKFVALLLNGDKETLEEMVAYGKEKGLRIPDLLLILPSLIKQKEEKSGRKNFDNPTPFISGRNEDFKQNIEFFEEVGFTVTYLFRKCKEILIMPHEKLVTNYRKFVLYGFTISKDEYGDLCHPALSCLLATNFDEIVDQFIEISKEGHQYIKENMSRITTTTTPQDLMFYNIYASYMEQDEMGELLIAEGPFVRTNAKKLMLRGEITRYAGSGYENITYRGVTEENKRAKTMTKEIECQNKEEFEKAVKDAKGREEELYNLVFDDPRILELECFTDIHDPVRYDFDGVLISKNKVFRIFNILKNYHLDTLEDSLLYAVTYQSIMNEEMLEKVKKAIKDRRK